MGGFECEVCGKKYKSKNWFTKHMVTHASRADPDAVTAASSSAAGQLIGETDDTSLNDASTSTSNPSDTTPNPNPNEDYDDDIEEVDENEERAAAERLDWGDWSGTDEDEEVETYIITEPWIEDEEEETRRASEAGKADVTPKKTRPPALVSCHCGNTFTTLDGYVKHLVGHGMEAALLEIPSKEEILKECPRLGSAVLQDIGSTKLLHGSAKKVADLALDLDLEWESEEMILFVTTIFDCFYTFLEKDRVFALPSTFVAEFLIHSATVSVDVTLNQTLREIIVKKTDCSDSDCKMFVANFVSKFSSKVLAHLLRLLCKETGIDCVNLEDRYAKTIQSTVSLDFKQNMHYIGGSNVKSFLKTALRVKHRNEEWKNVIQTIRSNFLTSELAAAPDAELVAWTETVDRGKLTQISHKALDFFVQLGKEVKPLERLDGSIHNDEVIWTITKSAYLLLRWDDLKGSLNERASFKLLHALTYHFCVTWRNGVIGRRHDEKAAAKEAQKFGTGGVAFRARMGGKKK